MIKELFSIGERIKKLRETFNITQADLARKLSLSRSAVNSWEMGLSMPTSQYVLELSKQFNVSTDYILGKDDSNTISVSGLSDEQINAVLNIIKCFRDQNDTLLKDKKAD